MSEMFMFTDKEMYMKRFFSIILLVCMLFSTVNVFADIYGGANTLKFAPDKAYMESIKTQHPRIFMPKGGFDEYFSEIEKDSMKIESWNLIMSRLDYMLGRVPPETVNGTVTSGNANDVFWKLWDEFPLLSLIYKKTGDKRCIEQIDKLCKAINSYPKWESTPDLATGHALMSVALAYDWLYDDLSDVQKQLMKKIMVERGKEVYEIATKEEPQNWNRAFLQNHMWIAVSGMACAAAVLYDEMPELMTWVEASVSHISTTLSVLPEDGFNHESVAYWMYGMESLFLFVHMARDTFGVDMITDYFTNTAEYLNHTFIPHGLWEKGMLFSGFADSNAATMPYSHMMWFIASVSRNSQLQWLTNTLYEERYVALYRPWLDILWYDQTLEAVNPVDGQAEKFKYFEDVDYVFSRSEWMDKNASYLTFRSGPAMGHAQIKKQTGQYRDWGSGHVHPDNNSFILFGGGDMLIRDDDYGLPKLTRQHNTLTIDGKGQEGEGSDWFNFKYQYDTKKHASVSKVENGAELDYIVGDATDSYNPVTSGLKKFKRHMLYLKPDVLIVVDDIEVDKPRKLETRLFPYYQSVWQQSDGGLYVPGRNASMRIVPLTPKDMTVETSIMNIKNQTKTFDTACITFTNDSQKIWKNAVALSWEENEKGAPKTVDFTEEGGVMQFKVGAKTITLNTETMTAKLIEETESFDSNVTVRLNGRRINYEIPPMVIDGATMVPFRKTLDEMGVSIDYDANNGIVTATNKNIKLRLNVDSDKAYVNDEEVELGTNCRIINDRLFLPIRKIAQIFGYTVLWDNTLRTVKLIRGDVKGADDANLLGISIDGVMYDKFDPEKKEYFLKKIGTKAIPSVAAIASDFNSKVVITPAAEVPGTTTIDVTSADGANTSQYKITTRYYPPNGVGSLEIFGVRSSQNISDTFPENTLDGKDTTWWSSDDNGAWIEYDLGSVKAVQEIGINFYLGDRRLAYFEVEASADGQSWKKVVSDGVSSGNTLDTQFFPFAPTDARYVRILGYGNTNSKVNSYTQVGFFDAAPYIKTAEISVDSLELMLDKTMKAEAKGIMNDGSLADLSDTEIEFSTSNSLIATVTDDGLITAKREGKCQITVSIMKNEIQRVGYIDLSVIDGAFIANATEDSYITEWRTDENFGNAQLLEIRNAISAPGVRKEAFIKFDITGITGDVTNAKMYIYGTTATNYEQTCTEAYVDAYALKTTEWFEMDINPSNRPAVGKKIATAFFDTEKKYVEFDITKYVQDCLAAGQTTLSISLFPKDDEAFLQLATREDLRKMVPYVKIYAE